MPRRSNETKLRIIEAAYRLFYKEGFNRAGIDAIAKAAGITKRSFYYHFSSKQSLIGAVLDHQHSMTLPLFERWAAEGRADPANMVSRLFQELAVWSSAPSWRGAGFTRAAIELAASPGHPARRISRIHKKSVEMWLGRFFEQKGISEPQRLARQVVLLLEGCHVLILVHGDKSYADAAAETARLLVSATTSQGTRELPSGLSRSGRTS
jgi:AcrR family transcriptional regulator